MADDQSKLSDKSGNPMKEKNSDQTESFAQFAKGVRPIKRKSQSYNRFEDQANHSKLNQLISQLQRNQNKQSDKDQRKKNDFNLEVNQADQVHKIILDSKTKGLNHQSKQNGINFNYEKLLANDKMEYRDFSISHKQMRALKAGKMRAKKTIDLHGYTRLEASELVSQLIENYANCTVLIIHGKGYNSTTGEPTLKSWLNYFLRNNTRVRAFASAPIEDGGTGACLVLLR